MNLLYRFCNLYKAHFYNRWSALSQVAASNSEGPAEKETTGKA